MTTMSQGYYDDGVMVHECYDGDGASPSAEKKGNFYEEEVKIKEPWLPKRRCGTETDNYDDDFDDDQHWVVMMLILQRNRDVYEVDDDVMREEKRVKKSEKLSKNHRADSILLKGLRKEFGSKVVTNLYRSAFYFYSPRGRRL